MALGIDSIAELCAALEKETIAATAKQLLLSDA